MISRRNFLKLAGLSTVALGAGYTTGKLTQTTKPVHYSIHGFIPDDEEVIRNLVTAFKHKVKSSAEGVVMSDSKLGEVINRFDLSLRNSSYDNKGEVTYTLKRLSKLIDSDIIASDLNNAVYSLDDLNLLLYNVRHEIKGRKAKYVFTAEYKEMNLLSRLYNGDEKKVIIENEKGIFEEISLDKKYNNIFVNGVNGKTGIEINSGVVRVHSSSCRHEICKQSMAHNSGDIIACAPNKVLVRVV